MSDLHLYPDRRTVTKLYPVCLFYPTLAIFVPIVNKGSISWPQEELLCYGSLAHHWEVSVQSLWSAWVDVSVHWLMQFSIKDSCVIITTIPHSLGYTQFCLGITSSQDCVFLQYLKQSIWPRNKTNILESFWSLYGN